MKLRKVLAFGTALGLTLPKEFTGVLMLERGDYVEIYLKDMKTIIVKRHGVKPKNITIKD